MKDWDTLQPDVVKLMNKHFTAGRGGEKVRSVVIHHNAGVLSIDQIWQVWQYRPASAHYQVETGGRIGQLVWDRDTAWHAANSYMNRTSIGIEISNSGGAAAGWPIASKAVEEAAHLVAAICKFYKLGRPEGGKNVRYHREFTSTSCPHHLAPGGKYNHQLMSRAQYWYDAMTGATTAPKEEVNMSDGPILGGVSAAALNDAKLAAQGAESNSGRNLGILEGKLESIINPDHSFDPQTLLRLIDAATWEQRKLSEAIARKLGLDPEQIIEDAIKEDRGE